MCRCWCAGSLRAEEDAAPKLAVSSIQALEDVKVKLPQNVRIKVTLDRATDQTLLSLQRHDQRGARARAS